MNIVVGYVATPAGEAALEKAIDEAKLRQAKLVVLNSNQQTAFIDARNVSEENWEQLQQRMVQSGVEFELIHRDQGHNATEDVLDVADGYGAELIVIGLRKRSTLGKLFMGSTAQHILIEAKCPVLAVHAKTAQHSGL